MITKSWRKQKKDIKYSSVILEENERKDNEDFLSHMEDLEQLEYLGAESSNKTIRSCDFKNDNVNVLVGYAEDNLSFEVVMSDFEGYKKDVMKSVLQEETKMKCYNRRKSEIPC